MARTKTIGVRGRLEALLPRRVLSKMAREVGLCRRERKVRVAPFFWPLVLQRRKARLQGKLVTRARSNGAITFVQRFNSALELSLHFHMLGCDQRYGGVQKIVLIGERQGAREEPERRWRV